ncbi:MAG: tetratricopeptide repeat protein [Spirochaetales bacterium]|nr:MAG: tetratricopeptide repeat protein [Spirochaetales bacterium]
MSVTAIIIIIVGIGAGLITFFMIRMVMSPKQAKGLVDMLKQGKSGQVIKTAKQMLAKDPRNFETRYLLGQAYQAENKHELALVEFKSINQTGSFGGLCPEREFREKIAALYENFSQPEEALKEYLLLIRNNPENAEYYFKSGVLFEERGKLDKAVGYYRKTIELDNSHSMGHFRLGLVLYKAKKPVESKNEFEIAVKLGPDNYRAYFYMGRLLKEGYDYIGALSAFEKAQRDPDYKVKALVERGACFMSMNHFDNAIAELERAVKLIQDEGSTEALYARYFLATCYEKTRKIEKALQQWEKIYSKKSSFKDVAEKLSEYQALRTDDRVKEFLTASGEQFSEICKTVAGGLNLTVRDVNPISNGCEIIATDNGDDKWRNARKMPKLLHFLRVNELINESAVRAFHEEMRVLNIPRGIMLSSSSFSKKAQDFAETRPIDLYGKEKFQDLLKSLPAP